MPKTKPLTAKQRLQMNEDGFRLFLKSRLCAIGGSVSGCEKLVGIGRNILLRRVKSPYSLTLEELRNIRTGCKLTKEEFLVEIGKML